MIRNLVGQSPSATFICSQESPQSTRKRLRRLFLTSCQYEINSGPVFDEVLRILGDNVIEYKVGPKPNVGLYVGIIFKANTKVVQEFYLNDSRGSFNLVGYSGDRAIAALASLPRQLRKLVIQANVVLVKAPHSVCPDT
jgi:hypothetical protein